jgi:ABC-2 type transport system ATP-binding protein
VSVQVRGSASELALALEQLDGVESVGLAEDSQSRLLVETDRSRDLRPDIARFVVEKGMDLVELKLMDLSLEDIFMQLVTKESSQEELQA